MSAFAISMGFLPNTNKQHTTENDQDDQGEDQTTHEEEHCNGGITMVHDGMFVVFRWNRCYEKEVRMSERLCFRNTYSDDVERQLANIPTRIPLSRNDNSFATMDNDRSANRSCSALTEVTRRHSDVGHSLVENTSGPMDVPTTVEYIHVRIHPVSVHCRNTRV
jgi:hypothetical protein